MCTYVHTYMDNLMPYAYKIELIAYNAVISQLCIIVKLWFASFIGIICEILKKWKGMWDSK